MEKTRIDWNIVPHYPTNFEVYLVNCGDWNNNMPHLGSEIGKWLCFFKPVKNNVPTLGDQRNFLTGLFEAEWLNDNYVLKNGNSRPPQREKKINMFKSFLDNISDRSDVKDTDRGLDFYMDGGKK